MKAKNRKHFEILRVQAIRRLNLTELVAQRGAREIADIMGWANTTFISQMCGPRPSRVVTEHTARNIESKLGLKYRALDR